jgi:hypothetical protein
VEVLFVKPDGQLLASFPVRADVPKTLRYRSDRDLDEALQGWLEGDVRPKVLRGLAEATGGEFRDQ